jgi:hypothetical protein
MKRFGRRNGCPVAGQTNNATADSPSFLSPLVFKRLRAAEFLARGLRHFRLIPVSLLGLGLFVPPLTRAQSSFTTNNIIVSGFFSGTIALDGDISDFFQPDGLTPRPGVAVQNDPNGLNESALASSAARDGLSHPSGFNQRRLLSAYSPDVNGGTIYVGIDLPGGSGANSASKLTHALPGNPNPNYFDGFVGGVIPGAGRGRIVPFDADANGEADTIGRTAVDGPLFQCQASAGGQADVLNCSSAEAIGASDNPRVAAGEASGARESYVVTLMFGNFSIVQAELFVDSFTLAGAANLISVQTSLAEPVDVFASTITGRDGEVLGYDVEMAITNVNRAVPNPAARFHQFLVVNSGSNRDGSGQSEDNNVLECTYLGGPLISSYQMNAAGSGCFRIAFTSCEFANCVVVATTNVGLSGANWTVLGSPRFLGNCTYEFIDCSAGNHLQRYYRLRCP